ncbi:hypothetical protein Hanom_Chr06g00476851 [Helianthus anomalus]
MDVSCVDPADHYGSKHCGYSVSHALQVKKSGIYMKRDLLAIEIFQTVYIHLLKTLLNK